jgi:tubulin polyglutamylase TTLL2
LSRGRGIYLFKELHELTYDCNTIIQRYIDRPLLISGFKFDLRCYVVVRSYDPLIVYFYRDGLARFATEPYNLSSLANRFSHLTNTSINMLSPSLDQEKDEVGPGCKWDFGKLRHYMAGKDIDIDQIWKKIKGQILLTLLPIAQQVPKVSNGLFELYGFDFLVDESFHTWLLEINLSPSLSVDSDVDKLVKKPLIQDILLLLDFKTNEDIKIHPSFVSQKNNSIYAPSEIGNFNRIFPDKVLPCNRKFDDRRVKKLIFEVKHKYFGET